MVQCVHQTIKTNKSRQTTKQQAPCKATHIISARPNSDTLIVWSAFSVLLQCWVWKVRTQENVPDRLLKGAAISNSCCTDLHNQRWLSVLRELCAIIERHDQLSWYFQCGLVSLNVCKEYLNINWNRATFKIPFLLQIKNLNLLNAFLRHRIREL